MLTSVAWGCLLFHPRNMRVGTSDHSSCSHDSGTFLALNLLALLSSRLRDVSIAVAQMVKNLPVNAGDLLPWVGKMPWRRESSPLQYSCLENPMDRGAW